MRLKGASGESEGLRRYDKENLLRGQAANRKGCAAMTRKTYCGNLLWQSGLTLLVPSAVPSTDIGICVRLIALSVISSALRLRNMIKNTF